VTYRIQDTAITGEFICWAVVFDRPTGSFSALRERSWRLDVHRPDHGVPQRATADAADRDPTRDPLGGTPFLNTELNRSANDTVNPVDPATTVHFTSPHTHPDP